MSQLNLSMNVVMIINVIIQTNKAIYLPIRAVIIISFGFDLENSNNFDTGNFVQAKIQAIYFL